MLDGKVINDVDGGATVEIRPILEAADFGDGLTPELHQREDRLRAELEARRLKLSLQSP